MFEQVAVLIPCYNEELTIQKVVSDWSSALPGAKVYVYDNNSTDNSVEKALLAGAIVRHEPKQGKGNVIHTMFQEVEAECYITVDGDDACSADVAQEMVDLILNEKIDMVVGDRLSSYFSVNKRPFHNFGNFFLSALIKFLFKSEVNDTIGGYRAFSRAFVKSFPAISSNFEIEPEMTIYAAVNNLRTANLPVVYRDRPDGSVSKLNTFKDGFRILRMILKLFWYYNFKI